MHGETGETVDKKDLLVVSEHDKEEYDSLLKFILHEVFVTGTADKTRLLVTPENEVELLTFNFTTRNSKILRNRFIERSDRNGIRIERFRNKRLLRDVQL